MLAKLLKNDFIQTGRMFLWVLGVGVVGGGVGALFTLTREVSTGGFVVALLWNFLLMLGAAALQLLAIVVILVGTNRSLFTERGYLTFALPVSTIEMLTSKFITMVVFMLLSIAEAVGLCVVAMLNIRNIISKAADSLLEGMNLEGMKESFTAEAMGLPSFAEFMEFLAYLLVVFVVLLVLVMMGCLFVLTISHIRPFQARPGLWIVIFLVACIVACWQIVKFVSTYLQYNVTLGLGRLGGAESPTVNMVTGFTMLALSAGFFFLTNWLLSRKISLK